MSGCRILWSFSPDRAPLVVRLALDPPPLKPDIAPADNTFSCSLLVGPVRVPCTSDVDESIPARCTSTGPGAASCASSTLPPRTPTTFPAAATRTIPMLPCVYECIPARCTSTGSWAAPARCTSTGAWAASCVSSTLPPRTPTTFPAAAAVLGTDVVASVLVIAAWAAFVFELVEVPFITAFELVFKLAFARNFSFASCSIAISFS